MAKFILPNSMVNKYLSLIIISLLMMLSLACNEDKKNHEVKIIEETKDTLLSPLIKYTVMVQDTSLKYQTMSGDAFFEENEKQQPLILPYEEFRAFCYALKRFINNPDIFVTDNNLKPVTSKEDRKALYCLCDSIQFLDKPNDPPVFMCDSLSQLLNVSAIDFYETWTYNKETGSIDKEILAYCPAKYVAESKKFFPRFYIFKDQKAFEKVSSKTKTKK